MDWPKPAFRLQGRSIEAITFDFWQTLAFASRMRSDADLAAAIWRRLEGRHRARNPSAFISTFVAEDRRLRRWRVRTGREYTLATVVRRTLRALHHAALRSASVTAAVDGGALEHVTAQVPRTYPGVHALLDELRKRYVLGLVSNTRWANMAHESLRRTHLAEYFRVIVLSAEQGYAKPHRHIFAYCVRQLGVSPQAVIHVGNDPQEDVWGARNAGLMTVHVSHGGHANPLADLVVTTTRALAAYM